MSKADKWYLQGDTVGCHAEGGVKVIIFRDIFTQEWTVTNAVGQFKFGKKNAVESYAQLPAWFQAGAPQWRSRFFAVTDVKRPIQATPLDTLMWGDDGD